jgi:cation diffusion facilitator CzcD-associated flavoprotein CzcO
MAGRLHALKVCYLVVEQRENVGDTWLGDRYESIRLHTPKEYNQLPGLPRSFQAGQPDHLGAPDLKEGFSRYVDTFGIRVSTGTTLIAAKWVLDSSHWSLSLRKAEQVVTMRARHIVLAVGSMGVTPFFPPMRDRETYQGVVLHDQEWKSGWPWEGKTGIVVGSANTAQWVINDMAIASLKSITMIQRNRTFLLPASTFSSIINNVYNAQTPTEASDRDFFSYPLAVQRLVAKEQIRSIADQQPQYFERILSKGFDGERYGDLWGLMYDREGGHFFDLGAGELIANGTVQVRSNVVPVAYTPTGVKLSDGSCVDADVVVFATGYSSNIKDATRKIFGVDFENQLQEFWQCDAEGEIRGAWKYIGRKRLVGRTVYVTVRMLMTVRSGHLVYWACVCACSLLFPLRRDANKSRY